MNSDRFARARDLFLKAIDLPDEQRETWLAGQCGDDESLRLEVLEFLSVADDGDELFEQGAVRNLGGVADASETQEVRRKLRLMGDVLAAADGDATVARTVTRRAGDHVGDFLLVREIGRGGMGVVFEARQRSLDRRVALKILGPAHAESKISRLRFEREARAAANLQHTNIVPVFGVGDDSGLHYYVMQYVEGRGLDVVLRELQPGNSAGDDGLSEQLAGMLLHGRRAPGDADPEEKTAVVGETAQLAEAPTDAEGNAPGLSGSETALTPSREEYFRRVAELGAQVAEGLAYAHAQGILHRDIKPANLLLDGSGHVWLTDFGLARVHGEENLTATGDLLGTLRYMPPEAFRGDYGEAGEVYSLGLTLFELLSRRPAFADLNRAETIRAITETGPGSLVGAAAAISADLRNVVEKAVELRPGDRYASAGAFAEDLRRFLNHEPVRARRISAAERLTRWCRRNRMVAGLVALVVTLLVAGLFTALSAASRMEGLAESRKTALTDVSNQKAAARRQLVEASIHRANSLSGTRRPGQRLEALKAITAALRIAREDKLGAAVISRLRNAAISALAHADIELVETTEIFDERPLRHVAAVAADQSCFAYQERHLGPIVVRDFAGTRTSKPFPVHGFLYGLDLSHDGRYVAARSSGGGWKDPAGVDVWEVESGRHILHSPLRQFGIFADRVLFADDDRLIVPKDQGLCVYTLTDPTTPRVVEDTGLVTCLGFSHDRETLLVGTASQEGWHLKQYSWPELGFQRAFKLIREATRIAVSTDGLVTVGGRPLQTFDLRTGEQISNVANGNASSLSFDSSNQMLLVGTMDEGTSLIDVRTGLELVKWRGRALRMRNDELINLLPGRMQRYRVARSDAFRGLVKSGFLPRADVHSNNRVAFLTLRTARERIEIWDLISGRPRAFVPAVEVTDLEWNDATSSLFVVGILPGQEAKTRCVWRIPVREEPADNEVVLHIGPPELLPIEPRHFPHKLAVTPDGRTVAVAYTNTLGGIIRLNLEDGSQKNIEDVPNLAEYAAVSPDSKWLATGTMVGGDGAVYDADSGDQLVRANLGFGVPGFTPDGRYALLGTAGMFEVDTWTRRRLPPESADLNYGAARFAGNMAIMEQHTPHNSVRIFDNRDWTELAELNLNRVGEWLRLVALSPDGSRALLYHITEAGYLMEVWDLRVLRSQLSELGLDWSGAPIAPPSPNESKPVRVEIDMRAYVAPVE